MNQPLPILDERCCATVPDTDAGFGALETAAGILPLKAMAVHSRITGLAYTLNLTQTFVNAYDQHLEATYVFPLPSRAAVTRFRLKVADRVIEGQLKERQEARQEYEQAIRDGHRAALAEEDRPSVFSMKVGNILPGETAEVELELCGQVTYTDGEAEFRFPFVVAPRYIPGLPLPGESVGDGVEVDTDQVPDASRISPPVLLPGFPNPVKLSLDVIVDGGALPVRNLRSSLHAVSKQESAGVWTVAMHPGERLNRDFILRFEVAAEKIQTNLVVIPDADGPEGTFQLTLVPPAAAAKTTPKRDVVFILDRSGSMEGWKMVCARRAIGRMVDTLTDRDRFAVMAFDNSIELPPGHRPGELRQATDRERFRTVEWLGQVDAAGGTEMAEPLDQAVKLLASSEAGTDRIILLVTDGQVGNEDGILRQLGDRINRIRIMTLGIDRAVNEGFLQRLAAAGGGHCELIESEDRLDEVMDRTHRRISAPVLTDLQLKIAGATLEKKSISPVHAPDLFAGTPAVISGRYRNLDGELSAKLTAKQGDEKWSAIVAGTVTADQAPVRIWARSHLRDLEDLVAAGRAPAKAEEKITAISLRFGVLCRYTAFVAVDKSEKINRDGKPLEVTQPVEPAEGWDMLAEAECGGGQTVTLSRSAGMGSMAGAGKSMAKMRCRAPQMAAPSPKKCEAPGGMSSMLGAICDKISDLLSPSEPEDEEAVAVPPPAPAPEPATLEAALQRLNEIIDELRQALNQGTDNLARALFAHRDEIIRLVGVIASLGGSPELVKVLSEIGTQLAGTTPPDAARTAKLWELLEALPIAKP